MGNAKRNRPVGVVLGATILLALSACANDRGPHPELPVLGLRTAFTEDLDAAERYFNLALSKEPGYARAYAGIGLLWMGRNQMGFSVPADGVPKAKAAALKAVELDDALADAHFVLACVYAWADWDWPAAEREFRRAIQLNPGFADAHAYYAHLLNILHRPDEAMVEARRSLELDPFNGLFKSLYAVDLIFVHRFDEAIAQADAALLTNPADLVALTGLFSARHNKREYKQALEAANGTQAPLTGQEYQFLLLDSILKPRKRFLMVSAQEQEFRVRRFCERAGGQTVEFLKHR